MNQRSVRAALNGEKGSGLWPLLPILLFPLSLLYAAIMKIRGLLYSHGVLQRNRLDRPVISVGNITAGGTGKTPVVAHIARWYSEQGKKVAVLSRGYGGKFDGKPAVVSDGTTAFLSANEAGDEPILLSRLVPGLVVVIGHDRYKAGLLAVERFSPDIFILDDGFQHLRLQRELDIVLLDAKHPFGNGFVLPAGLLREPKDGINRAGLLIHTRHDGGNYDVSGLRLPSCRASHVITGFTEVASGRSVPKPLGAGAAFAAIADPSKFIDDLQMMGLNIVEKIEFGDHADYDSDKLRRLSELSDGTAIDYYVTTAKDAVKLSGVIGSFPKPLYVAELTISFNDSTLLEQELRRFL